MGLRHWLIRKLACGDMVAMNFDRRLNGALVPKNLGGMLLENVSLEHDCDVGIRIGVARTPSKPDACLYFPFLPPNSIFRNCTIMGSYNRGQA